MLNQTQYTKCVCVRESEQWFLLILTILLLAKSALLFWMFLFIMNVLLPLSSICSWRWVIHIIDFYPLSLFQAIAVGYAIMTTRSVHLNWHIRALRVLPIFLLPVLFFIIYSAFRSYTKMRKYFLVLFVMTIPQGLLSIIIWNLLPRQTNLRCGWNRLFDFTFGLCYLLFIMLEFIM